MISKYKIAVVLPYFGKLIDLARLFFSSCKENPEFTFFLFTDQVKPDNLPANVIYKKFSIKQFNYLVANKIDKSAKIVFPYKLCDFKPLYGHIFEEYIKDYDFWGYTDIDMLLGRMSLFINDRMLEKYDIISSRKDSVAGNFTLFKNTFQNKYLYQKSDNWFNIIKNSNYVHSFPERFKVNGRPSGEGLLFKISSLVGKKILSPQRINDLNEIINHSNNIKVFYGDFILSDEYFLQRKQQDWYVFMEDGLWKDNVSGKTGLYFHFYRLKNIPEFRMHLGQEIKTQDIIITKTGITCRS